MSRSWLGLILLSVTITALAQVVLKAGMSAPEIQRAVASRSGVAAGWAVLSSPIIIIGLILYGVAAMIWLAVLSKVEISLAYPFVSLGFVITAIAGNFLFSEEITATRLVAIATITIGVVLLARS